MAFERIGTTADVPAGEVRVFQVGDRSVCLANLGDAGYYAIDNLCTHDNGPLGEGSLVDATVECPRHSARFDVKTGSVKALPAVRPVRTYPVQVQDGEISVDVE